MNINEICQVMKTMKECGASKFSYNGLTIEFANDKMVFGNVTSSGAGFITSPLKQSPAPSFSFEAVNSNSQASQMTASHEPQISALKPNPSLEDIMKLPPSLGNLSEEEILYAATPYFDEIQKKKAEHQQKVTEEIKS